jgi:hypothetical protein
MLLLLLLLLLLLSFSLAAEPATSRTSIQSVRNRSGIATSTVPI